LDREVSVSVVSLPASSDVSRLTSFKSAERLLSIDSSVPVSSTKSAVFRILFISSPVRAIASSSYLANSSSFVSLVPDSSVKSAVFRILFISSPVRAIVSSSSSEKKPLLSPSALAARTFENSFFKS